MNNNPVDRETDANPTKAMCSCNLRRNLFAITSLLVTLLLIYGNSFWGEWHFDDFNNIVDNRNVHLQSLSWEELHRTLFGVSYGMDNEKYSRPLAYLSFGLNYFLGGTEVFGYHIVNFIIHFAAAVFLFFFIDRTLRLPLLRDRYGESAYGVALLSAFCWATSPLQVNAVSIIVQRMASLAGLGYVMALYYYVRAATEKGTGLRALHFSFCILAAILAVCSKENALMLPISIILYDIILIQGATKKSLLRMLKFSWIPLIVLVLLVLIYSDPSRILKAYSVRPFTVEERLLTEPRVLLFYVTLLLYPIPSRLTFLHDIEISRSLIDPWTTLAAILGIILILGFAVAKARRFPLLSFAILFFFMNHLIEGTVIPLELIYEHRNYIPSMFFFVPIAVVMVRTLDYFSYRRGIQYFMAGGFALLLAFQGHTTFERNDIVRSDLHLWLDNVRKAPCLSRPRINLAKHYYEAGMYDDAYRELKAAEDLNRDTNLRQIGLASYNLGVYYLDQAKDTGRAEQQFLRALARFPGHPSAIAGLATVYLQNGNAEQAWDLLKPYASGQIRNAEIANACALVLLKKGNAGEAIRMAARSMSLQWNSPVPWEIFGEAWRQLGQWQKAAQCWEEVLRLNPSNPRAHLSLLELYDRLRDKPALMRVAARCLVIKGCASIDAWLQGLARDSGAAAYAFDPELLSRIIKREVSRKLSR